MVVKKINRPTRNKFGKFSKNTGQKHTKLVNMKEDKCGRSSTQLIEVSQKRKQRNLRSKIYQRIKDIRIRIKRLTDYTVQKGKKPHIPSYILMTFQKTSTQELVWH